MENKKQFLIIKHFFFSFFVVKNKKLLLKTIIKQTLSCLRKKVEVTNVSIHLEGNGLSSLVS